MAKIAKIAKRRMSLLFKNSFTITMKFVLKKYFLNIRATVKK